MALTVLPMVSGCTDDEIAQAVGAGAIIAGAVVIGSTTHCEGGYRNVCHSFRDYWGNVVSECRQEYDSCAYLVPNNREELMSVAKSSDADVAAAVLGSADSTLAASVLSGGSAAAKADASVTEVNWGAAFGIGFDASQRVINAFRDARDNNRAQAMFDLGLGSDDIRALAQKKLPSAGGVDAVARKLNQAPAAVSAMFSRLAAGR